jgi:hypothetical protein
VLLLILPVKDRTLLNVLAIIGFLLSVLGIIIAYIQILSIKDITKQTQLEVLASIRFNNNLLMVSDLSRKAAMVDEIQGFIKDDKIELCILRMKEFYNSLFSKKEFKSIFEDFNIDLDNFQQHHLSTKNKLDKGKIITNLEAW